VSDVLVLALVLLLVASGYAAGRVHAEIGYRSGYRLGYRQGHADASRFRPAGAADHAAPGPGSAVAQPAGEASETRQITVVPGPSAHTVRHARG
jgi:hypothetical protein